MEDQLTLRDRFALAALEQLSGRMFDPTFITEARAAQLEPSELLASYCWGLAEEMVSQRPRPPKGAAVCASDALYQAR